MHTNASTVNLKRRQVALGWQVIRRVDLAKLIVAKAKRLAARCNESEIRPRTALLVATSLTAAHKAVRRAGNKHRQIPDAGRRQWHGDKRRPVELIAAAELTERVLADGE